jgi:hypothetical protein
MIHRRVYNCSTDNRRLLWAEMLRPKRPLPAQPSVWQMLARMWRKVVSA